MDFPPVRNLGEVQLTGEAPCLRLHITRQLATQQHKYYRLNTTYIGMPGFGTMASLPHGVRDRLGGPVGEPRTDPVASQDLIDRRLTSGRSGGPTGPGSRIHPQQSGPTFCGGIQEQTQLLACPTRFPSLDDSLGLVGWQ